MNIVPLIRELLLHHEKAVIPGFGAFSIRHRPAELNRTTGLLHPPAREVVFDNTKKADDGQLTALLARKQKSDLPKSREIIAGFAADAEEQIRLSGTLDMEGFGKLGKDKSGRYSFVPGQELLDKMQVFGLPELDIRTAPAATEPKTSAGPVAVVAMPTPKRRRWWIPAAVVALLAGLTALAYFTGLQEVFTSREPVVSLTADETDNTGRLVFGNRDTSQTDTLQARISEELDRRTAREQALRYEEARPETAKNTADPVTEPVQTALSASPKPYHIIAGSFKVSQNAERQKAQLEQKGLTPVLLPRRGNFYMVSLGAYDSREQAAAAMKQLRLQLGQELWVMKVSVKSEE